MNYNKSIKIAETKIIKNNRVDTFEIRMTEHSYNRMHERGIDENVIAGNIIALGDKVNDINKNGYDEAAIIDKVNNVAIIFAVYTNKEINENIVKIITVINKSNVWVKDNTKILNIN